MKRLVFILVLSLSPTLGRAKLVDKIVTIFDDQIYTYSDLIHQKKNFAKFKNIRTHFSHFQGTDNDLVKIFIHSQLIRKTIGGLGYIISDDDVESQITDIKKSRGVTQRELLQFLKANGITYTEYFEFTKQSIEYNIFFSRVIRPLISISEQEIKNEFYKQNTGNTESFSYNLTLYTLEKKGMLNTKEYMTSLKKFREQKTIDKKYRSLEKIDLGDVAQDSLSPIFLKHLKGAQEGKFTTPFKNNGKWNVFFVSRKDLVDSSAFKKVQLQLKALIYEKKAKRAESLWFRREQSKYFIKKFI